MKPITVLIADDHKLIREAWKLILRQDARFQVAGEASNGAEAIAHATRLQPQVVLLDINMSPVSGLEALPHILQQSPHSKVIGLSSYSQPGYAKKMMALGALGYVTKNSSPDELLLAINEVSENRNYICAEVRALLSDTQVMAKP